MPNEIEHPQVIAIPNNAIGHEEEYTQAFLRAQRLANEQGVTRFFTIPVYNGENLAELQMFSVDPQTQPAPETDYRPTRRHTLTPSEIDTADETEPPEIITCPICGDTLPINDSVARSVDGRHTFICRQCYQDPNTGYCRRCNTIATRENQHHAYDPSSGNEEIYCRQCFNNNQFICYGCDELFVGRANYSPDGRRLYCLCCYEENYRPCECCGEHYANEHLDEDGYCEECNYDAEHRERDRRHSEIVRPYDHTPRPLFMLSKGETKTRRKPYFGLEIEMERRDMDAELVTAKAEAINNTFPCYFKEDGSLSYGFEIVTHPLSYQWITNEGKDFFQAVNDLSDEYKAYHSGNCGLHIHVSKDAFTTFQLYKFLKFFYSPQNYDFIRFMSQRSADRLDQWANLYESSDGYRIISKARHKTGDCKYTAVNLRKMNTVEIRIFRGNLKTYTILKNIQFVKALYDFCRDHAPDKMNERDFTNYVRNNQKEYKELADFIEKKGL